MKISASQVQKLRSMSGVGMMECKNALVECEGDIYKAMDFLRTNSSIKADRKSTRIAADGKIIVCNNKKRFMMAEINSETDFAAKDEKFENFCNEVSNYLASNDVSSNDELNNALKAKREELIQSIGENIQIRRLTCMSKGVSNGVYCHSDNKLGAVVSIDQNDEELAKNLAMHVAATNPMCIDPNELDAGILEKEKAIFKSQASETGKDESIIDRIVEGKVQKFLSEVSLLSQPYVKDPELKIKNLLGNVNILGIMRLKVGEDIVVEKKDFAEEVASQLK